jgi:inhibitor of cysteine peptidase
LSTVDLLIAKLQGRAQLSPFQRNRNSVMKKLAMLVAAGLVASSFVCAGPAAAQSNQVTQITAAQTGQTIKVKAGTRVEISLQENLSTGYSWRTGDTNGTLKVNAIRFTHVSGVTAMPGASGTCVISFTPQNAGTSTYTFEYARPWAGGGAPADTFTLTVEAS